MNRYSGFDKMLHDLVEGISDLAKRLRRLETTPHGDVFGPSVAANNNIAVYDGTTGKIIKDGGVIVPGGGLGDVVGPAGAVDGNLAVFNTATGKIIKDGGAVPTGNVVGPAISVDDDIVTFDLATGKLIQDSGVKIANLIADPATPEKGDILYWDGANWVRLAHDSSGKFLKTGGHGANPSWDSVPAAGVLRNGNTTDHHLAVWNGNNADSIEDGGTPALGDVVGPAGATGGHVATFNGATGKLIQDGGALPLGDVVGPAGATGGHVATFNGATGKIIQDGGVLPVGDVVGPAGATNHNIPIFDTGTGKLIEDSGHSLSEYALTAHDQNANTIIIPGGIGTPSFDDLYDWFTNTRSSGRLTGGVITPHTAGGINGKIDVSEMQGLIFTTDAQGGNLVYYKKAAVSNAVTPTDLSVSWIYLDYDGGSLTYKSTVLRTDIHEFNHFIIGRVWRMGNVVEVQSYGHSIYNQDRRIHNRLILKYGNMDRVSGAVISAHATPLKLSVDIGSWYDSVNGFTTPASTTYEVWYKSGSSTWIQSSSMSLFSDVFDGGTSKAYEVYQNGDNLGALTANKYGVYWIFMCPEGDMYVLLDTATHANIGAAQATKVPSVLPPYLIDWAVLIGRVICKNAAAAFYSVESSFATTFTLSAATDHESLANLNSVTHTHLTAANATDLTDGGATTLHTHAAGSGDVVGPAGATDGHLALFDGVTGKLIKDGGVPGGGSVPPALNITLNTSFI